MPVNVIIYTECWATGGVESFVKNLLRQLRCEDVCATVFAIWGSFERDADEFDQLGVEYQSVFGSEDPGLVKRTVDGPRRFRDMLERHHFDVVHVNTMNGMGLRYCRIARRCGVSRVIAHSHNSSVGEAMRGLKLTLHAAGRLLFGGSPTVRLACGREAGRFLFGGRPFRVLKNGIEVDRFAFDPDARRDVRDELGIDDESILVGNIGRMVREKNPLFILRVFGKLLALEPRAKLLLVGSGELDREIGGFISDLGLDGYVARIPSTPDPERYYSALDAFILPSSFEGVPFTAIEAQCAGLPVLASSDVPVEAAATELFHRLPLDEVVESWAMKLLGLARDGRNADRTSYVSAVASSGHDVRRTVESIKLHYGLQANCAAENMI